MRFRLVSMIIFFALIFIGCKTMTNIQAADSVATAYQKLIPGEGEMKMLVMQPYQNSMVVLATKLQVNQSTTLDLFQVTAEGVAFHANGKIATSEAPIINQVVRGNELILFGNLPGVDSDWIDITAGEAAPVATAVVTFKNWQIEEMDIPINRGFMIIVKSKSPVEVVKLLDASDNLIGHYNTRNGNLFITEFIDFNELPLPTELTAQDVKEVKITLQPEPSEDKYFLLENEIVGQLLTAFNNNISVMTRDTFANNNGTEANVQLEDGSSVKLLHNEGNTINVIYQRGERENIYHFESEEMANLLRECKNQIP